MGSLLLALSIIQAVWAIRTERRGAVAAACLALVVTLGLAAMPLSPLVHAALVQFGGGLAMMAATLVSPRWTRGPRPVADEGTPSARTLGWLTPALVILQVLLGAGFRHGALPLWPHLTGSLLVGAMLLFAGMAVLQSYSMHESLARVSTGLLWAAGLQVTLGLGAYGVRVMKDASPGMQYVTAGHLMMGAATLGASLVFGLHIFYHVRESLLSREAAA